MDKLSSNMHVDSREQQKRAYKTWAPVYDFVFKVFLDRAQRVLAERAGKGGREILEIGVGTGLVLPHYPRSSVVTGIDISEDMLFKAKAKLARGGFDHVRALKVMDACNLEFAEASFDVVTLPFVITLIPDAEKLLAECARVLRPEGQIVIVSKIGRRARLWGRFEETLSPLARGVGLSTDYRLDRITNWLASQKSAFTLVEDKAIPPFGFFRLLRLERSHM